MFIMTGQIGTGTFDVNTLVITEQPTTADAPSTIIPAGGAFDLSLTFKGTGVPFNGFENLATAYKVSYFAEGIGIGANEVDLGTVDKNLVLGRGGTYSGDDTKLAVPASPVATPLLKPGVYRIAGLVTFPSVPGMTGFVEDLIIEVFQP
jgi:hypothetical protein